MTNGELQRIFGALKILGNRRMATLGADLKVARMLRALQPLIEPLEDKKRQAMLDLIDQIPEGQQFTPTQEQVLVARIQAAQRVLDLELVEVALPTVYALTRLDLPKELVGKEGAANNTAFGAILADLGPLYLMDEDV